MTVVGALPNRAGVAALSGERFIVRYAIVGDELTARRRAEEVCVEQTVEFPTDLLPAGDIPEHLVGRIEHVAALDEGRFEYAVSYALEVAGTELPQFLNVVFGNSSLKPGIRMVGLELPDTLLSCFRGPRYGPWGLRELLGVPTRPLLMSALKPLGLSVSALAELAYRYARAGVDIVKDDHGLANQHIAPFDARVVACAAAVARANDETGRRCLYVPQVTGPANDIGARARTAKDAGAGGIMVCPGLVGFDTMRALADDDALALAVISHPAWTGSFVTAADNGIGHSVLFGQLQRLAGADASIFPNVGGRFAFTSEDCRAIADGCRAPMGRLTPCLPTPGGGMQLDNIEAMRDLYGEQVILLVGGGLHRGRGTLDEVVGALLKVVEGSAG